MKKECGLPAPTIVEKGRIALSQRMNEQEKKRSIIVRMCHSGFLKNATPILKKEVTEMTADEEKVLKDFLLDINCLKKLDKWSNRFNLFDVLKIANMEIRHSNILAWLFNPNESHGLGDTFIKTFFTRVASKCDPGKYNVFSLLLQDFYSYQVNRESNNMDIVLVSREERTAVIIENKIWSGESPNQLSEYMKKSQTDYRDCDTLLYIFLTPDGRESSNPDNWLSYSYEEIIELLESSVSSVSLKDDVALVIQNYIDTVRKNIMKEKDEELVRICNEIYNKHRAALTLIFENVRIDGSDDSEIICDTLRELDSEGKILFKDKNKWQFFTEKMDNYLPNLADSNSSWGTNWVYKYFLEKRGDSLIIHFELGGWNLTEDLAERSNKLIVAADKKLGDYRYKRLYNNKITLFQDDYEEELRAATKSLVNSALEAEKKLFEKIARTN